MSKGVGRGLKDYDNLTEIQFSMLSEVGNIGAGNAATALASILDGRCGRHADVPSRQGVRLHARQCSYG